MRRYLLTALLAFLYAVANAQPYTDSVYNSHIKTIQLYHQDKESSLPVIQLGSADKLVLAFDDLTAQTSNYYYTLEHCDALWNSSRLSPAEYLQNFTEDQIVNYKYSGGTYQKYVHYELIFPNANMAPKYAGNYILKVYKDADQQQMVFTRKLYVLNPRVAVTAAVVQSNNPQLRLHNQKLSFTVDYGSLRVQNPATDMRVLAIQNYRPDVRLLNIKPTYIRGTQLVYNDVNINDFAGRNEFRYFDMRTLKAGAHGIARLYRDTANIVILNRDATRSSKPYEFQFDNNGNYYVLNQDGYDPRIDADYAWVNFAFDAGTPPPNAQLYVMGQFNRYKAETTNLLKPNAATGLYTGSMLLKQGVYDYEYVWVDAAGRHDDVTLEGSFYETGNDYQLFVYYRAPGARWEELAGVYQLSTTKKQ